MRFFKEYDDPKAEYDRFVKAAIEAEVIRECRKFKPLSEGTFPVTAASAVAELYRFGYKPPLGIKDVIFNNPATIVFWSDGTKTVVKAENEPFDPEKGLAMAISKKFLGNKGNYFQTFKKFIKEDTK